MPIDPRFKVTGVGLKRDIRPWSVKLNSALRKPEWFATIMIVLAWSLVKPAPTQGEVLHGALDMSWSWALADIIMIFGYYYYKWYSKQLIELPLKLPAHAAPAKDRFNTNPATGGPGKAEGILFLGNVKDGPMKGDEIWITNSDARTHILFLGTTGAGKTEGLKSLVANAMCWGSGFVYVDGKAQNTLWGDVYSLARRFGRDDDVLVLNYMTGNSDNSSRSNSLNPFSIGSASYLTQMMVGLMDDAGDDNSMWKGRAIALMSSLMPALTWKRDNQGMMLDVGVIRDNLTMQQIIKMSRDTVLPDRIIRGLQSYLDTLPGYVDSAFDDEGNERPPSNDQPMVDLSQTRQQHGYLTMQFTRSLSSLGDEYGYIFKQQLADIDMMDVVLNRRILVVLIPALEKSPDEAANLGKIVVAALKGMMGATLGAELEGQQSDIIDNNPTTASSPFMTIFDEVGYYTSPGMGVMAAQARSLGFSLVFAGQDMPALQKRVKEEALSITGNCNLKIFGKLEDPTETKDFFEKTVSSAMVSEASGFSSTTGAMGSRSYFEGDNITFQARKEASYDDLKRQGAGQVHFLWAEKVVAANMFYAEPKRVNVVRVQRLIGVSPRNWSVEARDRAITEVTTHLRDQTWRAGNGAPSQPSQEITWMAEGFAKAVEARKAGPFCAAVGVASIMSGGRRNATDAISAPGLENASGYWPFGAAGATAPAQGQNMPAMVPGQQMPPQAGNPPPFMQGGTAPAPSATTPSWMTGGAAVPGVQPPPGSFGVAQPASPPPYAGAQQQASSPPPFMPQPQQQQPYPPAQQAGYQAPPPYSAQQGGYGAPPMQQQAAAGQGLSWGSVMGAAPGMGTPPSGGQVVQAAPTTLPPWMGGAPAQSPQGQYGAPPQGNYNTPQPPYAPPQNQQYAVPPQGQYGAPPAQYGAPPQGNYAPQQGNYVPPQQGNYAPPPQGGYAPPPTSAPPPSWVQQRPNVQPPVVQQPPYQAPTQPTNPAEVEAILRNAAGNLSGEMFNDGQKPVDEEDQQ